MLLDRDGRGKVTDFGLSKSDDLATHAGGMTAGEAAGTPVFMVGVTQHWKRAPAPSLMFTFRLSFNSVAGTAHGQRFYREGRRVFLCHCLLGGVDSRTALSGPETDASVDAGVQQARQATSPRCIRRE